MSTNPIFIDTLFFYPPALTAVGTTTSCKVVDQDSFSPLNFGFQVTVASIGSSVVVRFEGSLNGVNFFPLAASDTTINANGTTGYNFTNFPLAEVRGRLVTINSGSPTVTFIISAR